MAEAEPRNGFIVPEVRAEFPGLRLRWLTVSAPGAGAGAARDRLRALSDRYRGAGAVAMRVTPVPHAFRAFYRQIGLDPDVQRIPSERAALARLLHGGFRSAGRVADACLVALLETGVPVWPLDADAVDATGPGIRIATAGDAPPGHVPGAGAALPAGSLVVADGRRVHAVLFEEPEPPAPGASRVVLFSIAVEGVPEIHVEEALWTAADLLGAPQGDC